MMRRSRVRSWSVAVAGLLALCGCPGHRSDNPVVTPTPACTRWLPSSAGPGDVGSHFPLSVGNRWVVREQGVEPLRVIEVTGNRVVAGHPATVVTLSDLESRVRLGDAYVAVDDHGVLELGSSDSEDTVTPLVVPYYSARFPLVAGDQFTSVDCTNLDFGTDLDEDGRNELADVRLVVNVGAVEPVTTPVGSFGAATRIEQRITLTLRATSSGQQETLEGVDVTWYSPGVGPVREALELPVGGSPEVTEVVGYAAGDAAKGLLSRTTVAENVRGPLAAVFDGTKLLVAGNGIDARDDPATIKAVRIAPGAAPGATFDVFSIVHGMWDLGYTVPALAAGDAGVIAAVAGTTRADLRLQRIEPDGSLLDGWEGTILATPPTAWASGCPPAIASDGNALLVVWTEQDRISAMRIDAQGHVTNQVVLDALATPSPNGARPRCGVVASDGNGYLVVYEHHAVPDVPWNGGELRAIHVTSAGSVVAAPIVLASSAAAADGYPRAKSPLAMVFDGAQYVLLLADGREAGATALTVRRLSPAAAFLDGDAATGGLVLERDWRNATGASPNGQSLLLSRDVPVVAWAGDGTLWMARISRDGTPVDAHDGMAGRNVFVDDPFACNTPSYPIVMAEQGPIADVLYVATCDVPESSVRLRMIRVGLSP